MQAIITLVSEMESPAPPQPVSSQVSVNSEVGASSIIDGVMNTSCRTSVDEVAVDSHEAGYILEDVPHLTHYLPHLPVLV